MAVTKWVRASGGNDSNSGDTFAAGWATIDKFYQYLNASGVKGDTLNIVNDGTHTMPTTTVTQLTADLGGTDYDTDPGFIMRGTDSSGALAQATVAAGAGAARFLYLRGDTYYVRIEGLFLDMSGAGANPAVIARMRYLTTDTGPLRFQACRIKGYDDNDANYGDNIRTIYEFSSSNPPSDWGTLQYCVIENCPAPVDWNNSNTPHAGRVHHCVIWVNNDMDTTENNWWDWDPGNDASNEAHFYNNTYYIAASDNIPSVLLAQPASDDVYGEVNWHSNAFWINTTGTITEVFGGKSGTGDAATWTGTIGYNIVYFGDDVASGDVTTIYDTPWSVGGSPKATDNVAYEQAATTLFTDPSSTYTWENVNESGYDLLVPADLRLKILTNTGLNGVLPGALPGAVVPPTPDPDEEDIPFLSVLPFYAPVLKMDLNTRISTKVNRVPQIYERKDIEGQLWREFASRRMSVAPGVIDKLQSGIETARVVFVESDTAVQLNASDQFSKFLPSAETVVISGGQYSVVEVKNSDATDTANLTISAVDKVAT
jgi:hypothetical protein